MQKNTLTYEGNIHTDIRGKLTYINTFSFTGIKRFYQIENADTNIIRAFHGHKEEGKYVYVVTGSIILCAVYIDDFKNPSKDIPVEKYILTSQKPQIIFIPPHFANGIRALELHTKVIFYSTSSLEESKNDDYRFPYDYWGKNIWNKEGE